MNRKRAASRGKKINPHYWIYCERETEAAYVSFLRNKYRIQIEIIPKISGSHISKDHIIKSKQGQPQDKLDKDFLLYNADVPEMLARLQSIPGVHLIVSNPSIELWFLLHYKDQKAFITTEDCVRELCHRNSNVYRKGVIDDKLKEKLSKNCSIACKHANSMELFKNPSSNMYILIEAIEDAKK